MPDLSAVPSGESHSQPANAPATLPSCGSFGLRIAADGAWFYQGTPIPRKELITLFASVLRQEADGSYWLVTPAERGTIEVEDCPFVAVEMQVTGTGVDQSLRFRTSLGEWVEAGIDNPLRLLPLPTAPDQSTPVILVRKGLEARLTRALYYDLITLALSQTADDDEDDLAVGSNGQRFALGSIAA